MHIMTLPDSTEPCGCIRGEDHPERLQDIPMGNESLVPEETSWYDD
jgi:hypothetical protein